MQAVVHAKAATTLSDACSKALKLNHADNVSKSGLPLDPHLSNFGCADQPWHMQSSLGSGIYQSAGLQDN